MDQTADDQVSTKAWKTLPINENEAEQRCESHEARPVNTARKLGLYSYKAELQSSDQLPGSPADVPFYFSSSHFPPGRPLH